MEEVCPACSEEYNDKERAPMLLPCLHGMCAQCVAEDVREIRVCFVCKERIPRIVPQYNHSEKGCEKCGDASIWAVDNHQLCVCEKCRHTSFVNSYHWIEKPNIARAINENLDVIAKNDTDERIKGRMQMRNEYTAACVKRKEIDDEYISTVRVSLDRHESIHHAKRVEVIEANDKLLSHHVEKMEDRKTRFGAINDTLQQLNVVNFDSDRQPWKTLSLTTKRIADVTQTPIENAPNMSIQTESLQEYLTMNMYRIFFPMEKIERIMSGAALTDVRHMHARYLTAAADGNVYFLSYVSTKLNRIKDRTQKDYKSVTCSDLYVDLFDVLSDGSFVTATYNQSESQELTNAGNNRIFNIHYSDAQRHSGFNSRSVNLIAVFLRDGVLIEVCGAVVVCTSSGKGRHELTCVLHNVSACMCGNILILCNIQNEINFYDVVARKYVYSPLRVFYNSVVRSIVNTPFFLVRTNEMLSIYALPGIHIKNITIDTLMRPDMGRHSLNDIAFDEDQRLWIAYNQHRL